jgi:hypothetical protein
MKNLLIIAAILLVSFTSCKKEQEVSPYEDIVVKETVNKLFNYTDAREWSKLQGEVFTPMVELDMVSLGMPAVQNMTSKAITDMWADGFKDLDAVFHLVGNHQIDINGNTAKVVCYSTATHFKRAATKGNTRKFNGTYDLNLIRTSQGWRIDKFKFNLQYTEGNMTLE